MKDIRSAVAQRRAALGGPWPADGRCLWGIALSGGGIRSATFGFGVLRALAHHKVLLRFDLISSVSGGGYVAAMLGRLFSRATSAAEVRQVADAMSSGSPRWFSWWLRANGRYLIPSGTADQTFAFALYMRNLVGVHFELGLIAGLLGAALAAIDIIGWWALAALGYSHPDTVFAAARHLPTWLPVVWLFCPLALLAAAVCAAAYWCVPWLTRPRSVAVAWCAAVFGLIVLLPVHAALLAIDTPIGASLRLMLWALAEGLLAVWVVALPLTLLSLRANDRTAPNLRAEAVRTVWTRRLARCLQGAAAVLVVGLIDRAGWFIAFEMPSVTHAGLALGIAATVLRATLPALSALRPGSNALPTLLVLGRAAGYALTFLLCSWWVSLVDKAALGAAFHRAGLDYTDAWEMLALLAVPALAYLGLTGRNLEFLNLSSLHAFYRARLVRSYLGAANPHRFGQRGAVGALGLVPAAQRSAPSNVPIGDVEAADDIDLDAYQPQRHGGPIHLINACINQTRDPRGGLFNQDRRGLPLTVASGGGMQIAQRGWQPLTGRAALTLGSWTAISGAAVSPGLGALTRGGIAALTTFAGMRLGYWWDVGTRSNAARPMSPVTAKSVGLLRELFGHFRADAQDDWFLSDGGHFENTGAYALLAERAEVIVLADCGADPAYGFKDLENLVRKARIDLQADVLFQRPKTVPPGSAATAAAAALGDKPRFRAARPAAPDVQALLDDLDAFGSLNDLASPASSACLALARITYGGAQPGRGILILVKPNLCAGLPMDLVNFKADNPDFPQQTTADQFFTESQWESYAQLGCFLGSKLDRPFIERLLTHTDASFEDDDCAAFDIEHRPRSRIDSERKSAAALGRLPSRIVTGAVGTTLGLGAVATVGVSTWQAIDGLRSSYQKQTSDERDALKELTELWSAIPPAPGTDGAAVVGRLAAAIARTADTLCPTHDAGWFQRSALARSIYGTTLQQCQDLVTRGAAPVACTVLVQAADPDLPSSLPNCLVRPIIAPGALPPPRYWAYDYSDHASTNSAHPCDPLAAQRRQAEADTAGAVGLAAESAPGVVDLPSNCHGPLADATVPTPDAAVAPQADVASDKTAATAPVALPPLLGAVLPAPAPKSAGPGGATAPAATSTTPAPSVADAASTPLPKAQSLWSSDLPPAMVCRGKTVYLQIYGAAQRGQARSYRNPWQGLGALVPPSEDVVATAIADGRPTPSALQRTSVRYHDAQSLACAQQLAPAVGATGWSVEPLSRGLPATPGTIEVWLAPTGAAPPPIIRR